MKKILQSRNVWLGLAALAWMAAGCATQNKIAKTELFFPAPPDEPKLQFLTAFFSEKSFRQSEGATLMNFVTGTKPAEKALGKPYGAVAYDKKIFICDTAWGAVLVADMETRRLGALEAKGEGALKCPLNIAVDRADGTTYVVDSGREQVVIFDKKGNYIAALGKKDEMKPRDIAVGTDRIYVADLKKHKVNVFDKASKNFLFEIPRGATATNGINAGSASFSSSSFLNFVAVASTLKQGTNPVAALLQSRLSDSTRQALAKYEEGRPLPTALESGLLQDMNAILRGKTLYDAKAFAEVELRPETKEFLAKNPQGDDAICVNRLLIEDAYPLDVARNHGALYTPANIAVDSKGRLYASDTGMGRIQVYDGEGNFLRSVGQMGDGLGMFARVKGITVDRDNRLYAADAMSQTVQVFNEEGKLLTYFGEPGEGPKIQNLPSKVLVDYEGTSTFKDFFAKNFEVEHLVIVINQLGPHKVSIYGFGHKK